MAETEGLEGVGVGLGLQEADAGVELGGDGDALVVGRGGADEGGVVGADEGDVGVWTGAEGGVAVTEGFFFCTDYGGLEEEA